MKPAILLFGVALGGSLLTPLFLPATEYYLDPVAGDSSGPGTREAPWGSLETVAASGRNFAAGDQLILRAGYHGGPVLSGSNPGPVTIRPETGARVTLANLTIKAGRYWVVEGLEISPETAARADRRALVKIQGGSDNVLRGCVLYTVRDISLWSAQDWDTRACDGVLLGGTRQLFENNRLENLRFALVVPGDAPHNTVRGNLIRNFSGDGMRGLGDFGVFEGNVVKNLYKVNANHPDAFQSWSQTAAGVGHGVVRGVTLRGNYFLGYEDPRQPFRGALQGIGCFDGFFEDWVVENNVIITRAWHGIAFYGARNCHIVNNTVADLDLTDKGAPWIKITAHKNKTRSSGNLVRNNLACRIVLDGGAAQADHNRNVPDSGRFFPGWADGDLRLEARSPARDAGIFEGAPTTDLRGVRRSFPGNVACDLGAYEFGVPDGEPAAPAARPWEPRLDVPPMPEALPPALKRNESRPL